MPTQVTNLKVFVASPSDVSDERSILEQVINELNKLPGERLGVRLELVKWETDTYPSLGEDAQSVINEQIGDSYDIFIGILWKRFGTSTNRGTSGTAEEFNHAYQRARKNQNSIRVMFYFNDSPVSPSEIDAKQLTQINEFKANIGEQGVYYWHYKGADEFERLLRLHLGKVMEEFGTKWGQSAEIKVESDAIKLGQKENLPAKAHTVPDTEEGFLDLIISSMEDTKLASESISRIGALMKELNTKTNESTKEIKQLSQPINPNEARPIINRQADNWENFAQRADAELPILSSKFRSGIDSYTKAAQLLSDFETKDRDQVKTAIDTLKNLRSVSIDAQKSTLGFRDVVQKTPRMTTRLNHAKRHLVETLDKILEEYEVEENLAFEAEKVFEELLRRFDSDQE